MTKKVTKDTIKKLIEEVLKGEQRLDEFKVSITNRNKISDLRKDLDFAGSMDNDYNKTKKDLGKLIDLDTATADILDDADFAAAVAKGSADPTFKVADWLSGATKKADLQTAWSNAKTSTGGGGGGGSFPHGQVIVNGQINPALAKADGKSPNKTKIATLLRKYESDQNTTPATVTALLAQVAVAFSGSVYGTVIDKIITRLKSPTGGGGAGGGGGSPTAIKDAIKGAISVLEAEPTDLAAAAKDLSTKRGVFGDQSSIGLETGLDAPVSGDVADADIAPALGGIAKIQVPMNELLKAQVMRRKTDPSTFKVGSTEISKLEDFAEEFETVAKAMDPANKGKLAGLTIDESIMLMTKISFVASLFATGKETKGQESGYVWEKMCALFLGGAVSGLLGGAADVVTNMFGGTSLSQKFILPATGITQAAKNINTAMTNKKQGESLYYFALIKLGGGSSQGLNKIGFALVKMERSTVTPGTFTKYYLKKDGSYERFGTPNDVATGTGSYVIMSSSDITAAESDLPMLDPKIPPNLDYNETIDQLSNNLSQVNPSSNFGKLTKATIGIADKLSAMQNVTNEYRNAKAASAATSGSFSSGNTSTDYADKISDLYLGVKSDYKTLFKLLGDYVGSKAASTFQEGKKITSDYLKKIISESFKK